MQSLHLGWTRAIVLSSAIWAVCLSGDATAAVGHIIGHIDGISRDGDHYFLSGWACQQGQEKSIAVQLFAADPADPTKRTALLAETANLHSEPAVSTACADGGRGKHRFILVLPYGLGPESLLFVHGLRIVNGVPNDAIAGSGAKLPVLAQAAAPYPPLPRLAGAYHDLAEHPGVFTTPAELNDLAQRINRSESYSHRRFLTLADQVKRDLVSGSDWDVTYSGADGGVYQYTFSYEPQDHHEAATRAALTIPPDAKAPAGAAVVAARLALYAALVKAGATVPGAPSGDAAAALAKRILLAWADHGFRDGNGHFKTLASFTQDGHRRPEGGLGLVLGRGVAYSVHAQDLLQSLGVLNADEARRANALHAALFDLIRQSSSIFFAGIGFPYSACSRYSNIETNAVAALLATARLLNDARKFNSVLYGGDAEYPDLVPWVQLFDHIIYGQADGPSAECVHNTEPDSLTALANHHDYQTSTAAPGEIADRFRNTSGGQGIGYPMFTLERLLDSAELLRNAGFDPYGYRGAHRQSLEMAMQYYACLVQHAGFYQTVTAANSSACPNAAQYYGKLVNGVDRIVLIGAMRFPADAAVTALEPAARDAAASPGASMTPSCSASGATERRNDERSAAATTAAATGSATISAAHRQPLVGLSRRPAARLSAATPSAEPR